MKHQPYLSPALVLLALALVFLGMDNQNTNETVENEGTVITSAFLNENNQIQDIDYPITEENIEERTWDFLREAGFSEVQASGIMGTIARQSCFQPDVESPISESFGLMQWIGPRRENLEAYAQSIGKNIDSAEVQLDFILEELNPNSAYYVLYNQEDWISFLKASTPAEAVERFNKVYTRAQEHNINFLHDEANFYYDLFHGK